ncbi:T9SS type B sorting domain-containing protein [uncultured Gelidibacter sp.]|uniref:T9SS type B sorting domain-containing protein n=1 Tax=uncultured Gelidibacter sp. TaxID=259318 RepID=UPI0026035927|nr:choice-of-anchor L domain-containing protein [uncultured Gelidibacter sp.]
MKSFQISLLALACVLCTNAFSQQIKVDDKVTPKNLIENHLIQGCVETSNIASPINGSKNGFSSFGYFERGSSNFPFENGIVLTTGKAASSGNTVISNDLNDGDASWGTDPDLETALGITKTLNATAIEFEFASISNQIQFNYILASEEYQKYYPCNYSDGFAFLIKRAGTSEPYQNIAIIPGTDTPVNTNTIRNGIVGFCGPSNSQYFDGYNLGDTNYNGRTTVMTASAIIEPNVKYHIKMVIADQSDGTNDSAVFIEGNSFNATVDLGEDITTCATSVTLNGNIKNPDATYSWYFNSTAISGQTQPTLVVDQSGIYTVKVDIPLSDSFCTIEDSIKIELSATQTAQPITDFELCDDASADAVEVFDLSLKNSEILKAVPKSAYKISYHYTNEDATANDNAITAPISNTTNNQPIYVRIEDTVNGCLAYSSFNLVVNALPNVAPASEFFVCDDDTKDGLTEVNLKDHDHTITGGNPDLIVSYHQLQSEADSDDNAMVSPYNNTSQTEHFFARVTNVVSGCVVTTKVTLKVLENPVINTDRHYIDACDKDHDGMAIFDLNSSIDAVLEGATGMTTSFYPTFNDAVSGTNQILNPSAYSNTTPNMQNVYIKVTNAAGCSSITPIELHSNVLLTGTYLKAFSICDVQGGDKPQFDLYNMEDVIANELPNVSVIFYETKQDQINNNPIPKHLPYTPPKFPYTLYLTLDNTVCTEVAEIELVLNPIVEFPSIGPVTYCDTDQDGFTLIDLTTFDYQVYNGQDGYSVRYFLTEEDAKKNRNVITKPHLNTSNPQRFYTRTTSNVTGCADLNSFEVTVLPAPETNKASDIIICDADQDGFSIVNLDSKISEIVSDLSNRAVSFHTTLDNAHSKTAAISGTKNYNAKTQTVYTRVENTITGCHSVEPIKIIVNTLPIIPKISVYKYCEDDSDGFGSFIFKNKDAEILNGQTGKRTSYYLTPTDAEKGLNAIDKNKAFTNTVNPQTIHVRVENITDKNCYATGSFSIEVGSNPKFNVPSDWFVCDDISNDGSEFFDLSERTAEIKKGHSDDFKVTYYLSYANAENDVNPIATNFANTKNPQKIFARIDNGGICKPITSFSIGVIKAPEANPSKPLIKCDTDDDGLVVFNLKDSEVDILNARQDNLVINYYEDAATLKLIANPKSYTSGTKTVYIKITNTVSKCYLTIPIELVVNLPETKSYKTALCVNTGPIVIGPDLVNAGDTYLWNTNQKTREIKINTIGTYSVKVTTKSGCITNHIFEVIESSPAKIEVTEHIDFSDPNNITVTISGIGNYMYQLNDKEPQESNVFENVPIGANLVKVIDLNGCSEVSKQVLVLDTPKFMTPNDDGYFDTWHITGVETLPGTIIQIYDRYGKLLARLTSSSRGWDGTYNGQKMPSSDYWFVADVKKKDGTAFQLTGHFALKR